MKPESGLRYLGTVLVGAMLLLALLGPVCAPYDPHAWIGQPYQPPSLTHWLGTDDMGQDLWSALLHGARHSVLVALLVALGATVLGAVIGSGAGYLGGRSDFLAMRVIDFQLTLPTLPLVLVVAFYTGPNMAVLIVVMMLTLWAQCARELRPQAAVLKNADFVVAQRAMGAGELDIILRHILPTLKPLIWAQFARLVHHAVLLESALAFLGLGDPEQPSWGATLYYANARAAFIGESWLWWVLPPGLAIAMLVLGFSLLGVGRPRGAALAAATVPLLPALLPERESADSPGALMDIRNLTVRYAANSNAVLNELNLRLAAGKVTGLLGASGAGKSTLVQTLLGLLPHGAQIDSGAVWFEGQDTLRLSGKARRGLHGHGIAWVPQAAMQSLNPVRTIGSQMREVIRLAGCADRKAITHQLAASLRQVGLEPELAEAYPHELSGGMRQRVVIAMAMCRGPRVLLADEATSGLDGLREQEIIALLVRLCRDRAMALLLISHDLALLQQHCDSLVVLEQGRIAATTPIESPVARAKHFANCDSRKKRPPVFELRGVDFCYSSDAALRDLNLQIRAGECVGLVGPSGAGKSTIARLAFGLLAPMHGSVHLGGRDLASLRGSALRRHRRHAHLIFQDPYAALPLHLPVREIVAEPLRLAGLAGACRVSTVEQALLAAGLTPAAHFMDRHVDQLSGGQRQRVALARALVIRPQFIVADEPTSMLDATLKYAWMQQLDTLRREHDLAVLLITHDVEQAKAFCDRIVVLQHGRMTETINPIPRVA